MRHVATAFAVVCCSLLMLSIEGCLTCEPGWRPITLISPDRSAVHTPVTIYGTGFGATQGTSTVTFNGLSAIVLSWSDTEIRVRVPVIATPDGSDAPASVAINVGGRSSIPTEFTVIRGIAFTTNRDGNWEIYVMNPDGSGQTRLTNNTAVDNHASWSPDGTKLAFHSDRDGNREIYTMNADGSGQLRLTTNTSADEFPSWSPDGTRIAFVSTRSGNEEIYVMNSDGTNQVNLTNNSASDQMPAWSPDGTLIGFGSTRSGDREVWVMNADGSSPTRLTYRGGQDTEPSWTPNGARIYFTGPGTGSGFDIWAMNPDGSNLVNITNHPAYYDTDAAFSPTGDKIAYLSSRTGDWEIFIMNLDGSEQTNLTNNPGYDDWNPAWR